MFRSLPVYDFSHALMPNQVINWIETPNRSVTVPVVQTVVDETLEEPPPAPIQMPRADNQFRQDRRVRGRPERRDNRGRGPRDNRDRRGYDRCTPSNTHRHTTTTTTYLGYGYL